MHFPKKLYEAFAAISGCQLIRTRTPSESNLAEFQTLVNGGQPDMKSDVERSQFETIHHLYMTTRAMYTKMITGTPVECTVLWTEAKIIVRHFNLQGIVYLSHDEAKGYVAALHEKRVTAAPLIAVTVRPPRPTRTDSRPKRAFRPVVAMTTTQHIERRSDAPPDSIAFEN